MLAITSPTSGGRSVGIVRSRTHTMEFSLVLGIRHADHVAPSIRKCWQSLRRQAVVARSI
jgi:hypothetical protein